MYLNLCVIRFPLTSLGVGSGPRSVALLQSFYIYIYTRYETTWTEGLARQPNYTTDQVLDITLCLNLSTN